MLQLNVQNPMHCHKKYFSVHLFCWIAAFPPYSLLFEKSETTLELRRFAEKELKRNLEKILLQFELRQATMASCSFKVHLEQNLQWVLSSKLVRLQPAWSLSFNRVNHHYWVKSMKMEIMILFFESKCLFYQTSFVLIWYMSQSKIIP